MLFVRGVLIGKKGNYFFSLFSIKITGFNRCFKNNLLIRFKFLSCPFTKLNWICERWKFSFEYGGDLKIYCECGGGDFRTFTFKCPDMRHGNKGFLQYEKEEIDKELGNILTYTI